MPVPHEKPMGRQPGPQDKLHDVTEHGLMSGGLPSTSLRDIRIGRETSASAMHPQGQGSPPGVCGDAEFKANYRQDEAGRVPRRGRKYE